MPLTDDSHVSWASDEPVPMWFDMAREFTERWVHQMQIREAVGRVDHYAAAHLPTVLRTFVWAIPHQYRASADRGAKVQIDLASGGIWHLVCTGERQWTLNEGAVETPTAHAPFSDDCGWRVFTGASHSQQGLVLEGPPQLCDPLLDVRAIIA